MASMDDYVRTMKAWAQQHPVAAKAWALPTTGNLAEDDYQRSKAAFVKDWAKKNPYSGYDPVQYGFSQAQMEEMGTANNASRQAFVDEETHGRKGTDAWLSQLTPAQRAEYNSLTQANDDKNRKRGMMAAAAMFAGIGGLGALGAGALGGGAVGGGALGGGAGLGGSGLMGAEWLGGLGQFGGLGGAEALGGAAYGASGLGTGLGASLGGAGALGAGALGGLGEAAGIAGNNISAWLPAGSGALDAGLAQVPSWALPGGATASELAGMGLGGASSGSSWLTQLQNILKGGGSLSDALKGIGGSGTGGVNWLNLLGNLGGGLIQSNASGNAANAQLQAGREANALLREMWQQGREDQKPYREAGTSALAGIQALLKDPSSIAGMPDYQFGFDQGNKALANSAAARGMTYSGQQGKALQRYGQDYAGSKLNESYNRLAGIAGIGQQAVNQTGNMGQQYANNLANNIENQGNVQGSAYMGKGNAWTNAIGGAINGLSEQALIDALLNRGP